VDTLLGREGVVSSVKHCVRQRLLPLYTLAAAEAVKTARRITFVSITLTSHHFFFLLSSCYCAREALKFRTLLVFPTTNLRRTFFLLLFRCCHARDD
jgi:hypothetical protein